MDCQAANAKEVLVQLGERNRVVKLLTDCSGVQSERDLLLTEVRRTFADQLSSSDSITLQIRDISWGGVFVDFFGETIDNRAVFKLVVEKVAEDGFVFKKGKSRSKVYGTETTSSEGAPKRPKLDEDMRKQRLSEIEENLERLSKHVRIKERRITQAEGVRNYKLCDDLLDDIGELRGKKRELEREKALLEAKDKRAKRRKLRASSSTSSVPLSSPTSPAPVTPNTPPVFTSPRSSGGYLSDSESESLQSHMRGNSTSGPESPLFRPSCPIIELSSEMSDCRESDQSFWLCLLIARLWGGTHKSLYIYLKVKRKKNCVILQHRDYQALFMYPFFVGFLLSSI